MNQPQFSPYKAPSDVPFYLAFGTLAGVYIFLILAMLFSEAVFASESDFAKIFGSPEICYSIKLSLISCSMTAILSLWVAVPIGYLMARRSFPGKVLLDAILDIPIVLPPLVIGLALLIFFQTPIGRAIEKIIPFTYSIPGVILAQFMVGAAFAVRMMRATFEQINPRCERVALTLGCNDSQAFWKVTFPQARRGLLAAGTMAWARALGEFGPILIFCGATRMRTEVLPTTIFLEMSVGNIEGAVAVSLLMVAAAVFVLVVVRWCGLGRGLYLGS